MKWTTIQFSRNQLTATNASNENTQGFIENGEINT